jgi:drug/metabolite transporter (DMT)-like permease
MLMVWITAGSAALLAPLFLAAGAPVPADSRTWALLVTLALVGQVAGQGLVTIALRELPASLDSIVLLIQPLVAAGLSWALLSETLSGLQVFGMSLVLVAIGAATMESHESSDTSLVHLPSSPKDVSVNGVK